MPSKSVKPCCGSAPADSPCCDPVAAAAANPCCPTKPALRNRPLLDAAQASNLAGLFKVLGNDTRLRMLHALARADELSVGDLAAAVGMRLQAVSNQLQRLHDLGIVATRRDGNRILYRIADCCVVGMLDQGLCLMEDAYQGAARPRTRIARSLS
jgi:DNA-binding transcriptional ArsR family regulator